MKTELTIISDDLNHGIIDENEARTLLLGLLGVSNSLPDSDEIRMKARELDEKDFAQWMYESIKTK